MCPTPGTSLDVPARAPWLYLFLSSLLNVLVRADYNYRIILISGSISYFMMYTTKGGSRRLEKSHKVWMMMMIAAGLMWAGAAEKPD